MKLGQLKYSHSKLIHCFSKVNIVTQIWQVITIHFASSITKRDRLLESMTNWDYEVHILLNSQLELLHIFSVSLPESFFLGWLWDSVVLQSAESGALRVQHGAHYRKSDARSENNRRSQKKETPSASSSESLSDRYCAPALCLKP